MSLIQLTIKGISYSQTQSGAYALVLSEIEGTRTLPIIIGAFEAQSIAIALETEIRPPRPLTHDLFKTFSDTFGINIKEVIIHKLVDGVFFSSFICEREGKEEVLDTRTSDAIAIAVRFNAPIYTYENILDKAGIYLKVEEEMALENKFDAKEVSSEVKKTPQKDTSNFASLPLKELHKQLNDAVDNENYELAAKIRDEISKRS
ncbi:UNVERIFIED_CONTAM: hypothetical protein GTU68_044326 [Idotea baltica]|nr:hypothetical protein [Idotea baltica]